MKTFLKVLFTIPMALIFFLVFIAGIIVRQYKKLYDWVWN